LRVTTLFYAPTYRQDFPGPPRHKQKLIHKLPGLHVRYFSNWGFLEFYFFVNLYVDRGVSSWPHSLVLIVQIPCNSFTQSACILTQKPLLCQLGPKSFNPADLGTMLLQNVSVNVQKLIVSKSSTFQSQKTWYSASVGNSAIFRKATVLKKLDQWTKITRMTLDRM